MQTKPEAVESANQKRALELVAESERETKLAQRIMQQSTLRQRRKAAEQLEANVVYTRAD